MQTDIFKKVPIEVPNRSGFDESHSNVFTATTGTLTPCFVQELLPNDSVSLGVATQISLPPAATDFYGRIRGFFEFFFVPNRLLWGDWQRFITQSPYGDTFETTSSSECYMPQLLAHYSLLDVGSLADYLGCRGFIPKETEDESVQPGANTILNPMRFLAYHKIYDDWYRDSRLQQEVFHPVGRYDTPGANIWALPYLSYCNDQIRFSAYAGETALYDTVDLFAFRQRNWARDYFTNATPLPQAGTGAGLAFNVENDTGEFSIASLRAANSLQQFLERMNIAGARYGDQIKAQFGVYPSDAALDRAIYLGRQVVDVYNRTVYQTNSNTQSQTSNNPFYSVGAKYASPMAVGDGSIIDNFTATEHGILMGIFSLVPDAMYAMASHRSFSYRHPQDYPFPLLAGVGDQAIYNDELVPRDDYYNPEAAVIGPGSGTFGYTQRYAEAKFMADEVHGLLRDDSVDLPKSLASFALQRSFDRESVPELGTDFIKIPTNYLDQVLAVTNSVGGYSCWVESYFSYKKISTLPAYSIPTLGDMKNTHTETIPNGGTRL